MAMAQHDAREVSSDKQLDIDEKNVVLDPTTSYTTEEEKRVLRKIDLTIMPLMCLVFFLQYLDKQSLSYASVFGLITDLEMTSSQYSWCSSIFYIGQLVAEYPCIYLMSKLHLNQLVGATVILWGVMCMCLAAPTSFHGFVAVRFLLGFTEGAVSPAFVTITSIWYQKSEHASRTALWVTMNGLAQVIGCLLMYGIGRNTSLALAPWRVMFIVCGALTAAAGVLFFFLMPNGPRDAWFLSHREKEVLSQRMARDREGGDKTSFSVRQLREAVFDIKTWFVFSFGVLVTMQSPVLTFASLVINTIGYDRYQTMLYTAPSGAVQILLLWIGVIGCWLFPRNRTFVIMALIIPPLVGNVLLLKFSLNSSWGMIAASWLASCITAVMSPLLSLAASNVKGNTKRSVVSAVFFIGYCAGCIASPQLWTEKPRYFSGVVTALVTWCLLFVVVTFYWIVCMMDNAKRDRRNVDVRDHVNEDPTILDENGAPLLDLTDKEDVKFRYSW
ncbi:major facilitator superfamily transporter [Pseudovirgaria hyperparasitica]|uniref:Major facilitator superfamily transporter n=1 Tax=Pseudovirgaria hyperparasitica TaxID=470096 RepID=A0A6A6WAE4_9PEZI|nr:major facilitator superfamily transporter [Pseudovirgaria hyperparasitica]KAF2758091.1 major facilitator superfamily transporter [Pseudovirgaria hyperparasitica]